MLGLPPLLLSSKMTLDVSSHDEVGRRSDDGWRKQAKKENGTSKLLNGSCSGDGSQ